MSKISFCLIILASTFILTFSYATKRDPVEAERIQLTSKVEELSERRKDYLQKRQDCNQRIMNDPRSAKFHYAAFNRYTMLIMELDQDAKKTIARLMSIGGPLKEKEIKLGDDSPAIYYGSSAGKA